jgi:hypothetical protein
MSNNAIGIDKLFTIEIGQAITDKIRSTRKEFTPDQRFEYAKLLKQPR